MDEKEYFDFEAKFDHLAGQYVATDLKTGEVFDSGKISDF